MVITKTQLEIMEYLWDINEEVTARDIRDHFSHKKWSKQTVSTFLKELVNLGYLNIRKQSVTKYFYSVARTKEQHELLPAVEVVDTIFNGSFGRFACSFFDINNKTTLEEIDEAIALIDQKKKELAEKKNQSAV